MRLQHSFSLSRWSVLECRGVSTLDFAASLVLVTVAWQVNAEFRRFAGPCSVLWHLNTQTLLRARKPWHFRTKIVGPLVPPKVSWHLNTENRWFVGPCKGTMALQNYNRRFAGLLPGFCGISMFSSLVR